jgi:Ca2+-binding EF-hand superfamily protein
VYIGSVYRSMWTVWQVVTLDSWISEIGRPLYKVSPESFWVLVAIVIVSTFGALSVIVAVMVENMGRSMESVHAETDKKLQVSEGKMMELMLEDFAACDTSKDGELDFEEFRGLVHSASFRYKLRLLGLRSEEAEALFSIMDADQSGSVSPEEFIGGLHKLKGDANGIDVTQLITFASRITQQAAEMTKRAHVLSRRVDACQEAMDTIGRGLTKELHQRHEAATSYDELLDEATVRKRVIKHVQDSTTDFPVVVNLPKPVGVPEFVPCKETAPLMEMPSFLN